jgi:hypothetical protein
MQCPRLRELQRFDFMMWLTGCCRVAGLGIGATPRREEKKAAETAESKLRKVLVGKKKDDDAEGPKKAEEEDKMDGKASPLPTPKKRKRNTFLDELLAERGGRKKDKKPLNEDSEKSGKGKRK